MASTAFRTFLWVVALLGGVGVEAFVVRGASLASSKSCTSTTSLLAKKESLVFTGDCIFNSDPINGCTREQVIDFFNKPETQLFLISAGGKRDAVRYATLTCDLKELWLDACNKTSSYGSEFLPSAGDDAVASDSIIQFPGLRQTTTVLNGVKTRIGSNGMPEYVFILIGEKKRVSGAAAIVWIYNKLTGASTEAEVSDRFMEPSGRATSVVTIDEANDASFMFKFTLKIEIQVMFPSTLLRILPTSKEKMEEQGSAAVTKAVSTDIVESLAATRDEFLKRLSTSYAL